jgi:hypothetical protein
MRRRVMMRSLSTSAFAQPRLTKPTQGAGLLLRFFNGLLPAACVMPRSGNEDGAPMDAAGM